ncbi:hypothetical protein BH24ACT3_BH24ACT3_15050 [soil metagenome]
MVRRNRTRGSRRDPASPATADTDSIALDGEEHAWWADRDLDRAWAPPPPAPDASPAGRSFQAYFTAESLFVSSGDETGTSAPLPEPVADDDGGERWYPVLGLTAGASWAEVTAAHRRLAKAFHPDLLGDADAEERARSEGRMREINIAFGELRRRRPSAGGAEET